MKINVNLAKDSDMRNLNGAELQVSYEKLIEDLMRNTKYSNGTITAELTFDNSTPTTNSSAYITTDSNKTISLNENT